MDDDCRELIEQLCTRAGMIMEDASSTAIIRSGSGDDLANRIGVIIQAGSDVLALGRAAEAAARQAS